MTLDAEYLADPGRAFPVVIDASTLICGSKVTLDTYISAAATGTNYYTSDYLKTGFAASGKEQWSLMKFELYTDATASTITSAKIRLEKHSGTAPSSLYARRITSSWSSSSVTYATKPSVSTSTSASNRSAKGVSDGDNWYSLSVTTMVKNMLNGTANYGWKIYDSGLTGTQCTSYYSSDYISPHRPELVIPHSPYYGNRAYEEWGSNISNCMGIKAKLKPGVIGVTNDELKLVSSTSELLEYINDVSIDYMTNASTIGSGNFEQISNYNSNIKSNRYRVVLRVFCRESNNIDGINLEIPNAANPEQNIDDWDYHWWYQTNTGQWAEIPQTNYASRRITNTTGSTNPATSSAWDSLYTSNCKYFAIKPNNSN